MARETVLEELDRGLMVLTLNRPEQRNAFNSQMYREMCECMQECLARDDVGAVLVTGAPGAFTAGQDLGEMSSASSAPSGSVEPGDHPFARFMNVLCEFDKPLIAAVNGRGCCTLGASAGPKSPKALSRSRWSSARSRCC